MVDVEYKAWNPYHGWQPIFFPDSEFVPLTRGVISAVAEIEATPPKAGEVLVITLDPREKARIVGALEFPTDVAWLANPANVRGIPDNVRHLILGWSLKLEKLGIMGEGLSFSPAEKAKAGDSLITIGNIQNFIGNIGQEIDRPSIRATQTISGNLDLDSVRALAAQINEHVDSLPTRLSPVIRNELKDINEQLRSSHPSQSKMRNALISIKSSLEGAAGNLIASGILAEIAKILPH
jgi:hypothetical protein